MKLNVTPRVNADAETTRWYREVAQQVNALSEGQVSATYNANTAAPTTGTYAQGDFVKNSAPVEAGSTNNKYVVCGWICVAGGTPGTWVQARYITGN